MDTYLPNPPLPAVRIPPRVNDFDLDRLSSTDMMGSYLPNPVRVPKSRGVDFDQLSSKMDTYPPYPPLPPLRIPKCQGFDFDQLSSKMDTYPPYPPLPPLCIPKCQGLEYSCGSPASASSSHSYYSAKSSQHSPALEDGWSKKRRYSPDLLDAEVHRNIFSYNLPDAEKHRRRAEIAVHYYNVKNGTSYELVEAILSNGFSANGSWFHCNFTAKQDGEFSCRVFFAEIIGNITCCSPKMETWVATACIALEGNTTLGCSLCAMVFHPPDGFFQGLHKKPKLDTPDSEVKPRFSRDMLPVPYSRDANRKIDALPKQRANWPVKQSPTSPTYPSKRRHERVDIPDVPKSENIRRAKLALDCYNEENNKDYEFVDAVADECMLWNGIWYHCNFTAKLPGDGDATMFFAEMEIGSDSRRQLSVGVTACHNLEASGKTMTGCLVCGEVIHPCHGFQVGLECC